MNIHDDVNRDEDMTNSITSDKRFPREENSVIIYFVLSQATVTKFHLVKLNPLDG